MHSLVPIPQATVSWLPQRLVNPWWERSRTSLFRNISASYRSCGNHRVHVVQLPSEMHISRSAVSSTRATNSSPPLSPPRPLGLRGRMSKVNGSICLLNPVNTPWKASDPLAFLKRVKNQTPVMTLLAEICSYLLSQGWRQPGGVGIRKIHVTRRGQAHFREMSKTLRVLYPKSLQTSHPVNIKT